MQSMSHKSPLDIFGDLFIDLHLYQIYPDGKLISDAEPKRPAEEILAAYKELETKDKAHLKEFFDTHFTVHKAKDTITLDTEGVTPNEHIKRLWPMLSRDPDQAKVASSKIPLPFPYVVPGGRFNEIYYWDSYFTMLGLALQEEWHLVESMVRNFDHLIRSYGHIPNGNRSYFMSRSQPPFYSLMVELLASHNGDTIWQEFTPSLLAEYNFWTEGADDLTSGRSYKHSVRLPDGVLQRYYDDKTHPREEMYHDDVELSAISSQPSESLYAHLRAACESGWDFSARWCDDPENLGSIKAGNFIPVDLNCLLYKLEKVLSSAYAIIGNQEESKTFLSKSHKRATLIQKYCWNTTLGTFTDYRIDSESPTETITAASFFPLFMNIASKAQAKNVCEWAKKELWGPGGLLTTNINSGQQWDAPNGWAPLQWVACKGLLNYKLTNSALELANNWTLCNEKVYRNHGKFVEKYNVLDMDQEAGGGEYPVQDGFGWSNGVYIALKDVLEKTKHI